MKNNSLVSGGGGSSKQDEQSRPASVTVTQTDSGGGGARQQGVAGPGGNMAPGHYNHSLHPMVPVDPGVSHHQQQQQQHHHHQQQHQQQHGQPGAEQQAGQPTNDTAFPGHHRATQYAVGAQGEGQGAGQGAGQMIQNNLHGKQSAVKSTPTALTKNKLYTEENGEVNRFCYISVVSGVLMQNQKYLVIPACVEMFRECKLLS